MRENTFSIEAAVDASYAGIAGDLVHSTSPEYFAYVHLGDEQLSRSHFAGQWQVAGSLFGYGDAVVARDGDELLGLLVGYRNDGKKQGLSPYIAAAREVLGEAVAADVLARFADTAPYLYPPFPGDAWYVQNLATAAQARGRGVGRTLLAHGFDVARSQGFASCHLDVASNNPAVGFYQRMGMRVHSESRLPALSEFGVPSHYRMIIEL